MKKTLFKFNVVTLLFIVAACNKQRNVEFHEIHDDTVNKITKYNINFNQNTLQYTKGYKAGIGSSIEFKEEKNGKLYFYSITDRGPNSEGPDTHDNKETIIFPDKDFSPYIGLIEITPNVSANLLDGINITENGKPITGIFRPGKKNTISDFLPLDNHLNVLENITNGIDSEGIAIDKDNNFWICEEYDQTIIKANKDGNIIKRYTPGEGLPLIIKNYIYNRGFESITVTPNGKVYVVLESVLNIDNKTAKNAEFIRVIELDPKTEATKMFAYPIEKNDHNNSKDVKIGDIAAIDDYHFLVIEQGKNKDNKMINRIFIIDITNATDISTLTTDDGKALEYETIDNFKNLNINVISKKLYLDPRKYGWDMEKMEGITIIDKNHIALTNDNDFNLGTKISNADTNNIESLSYELDTKKLFYNGKLQKNAKIEHEHKNTPNNYIWIFEMNNEIPGYKR